jgi:hypothetical protein
MVWPLHPGSGAPGQDTEAGFGNCRHHRKYNVGNHTQLLYGIAMDFLQCDISKGCDRNVRTAARKLRV